MMGKNLYSMCSYAYVYHKGDFLDKQSGAEIFLQITEWEKIRWILQLKQ